MSYEQDWEKRLLQRPLPEKGLPLHVREGIRKRIHETPKSLLQSVIPIGGGAIAVALVTILAIHNAGSLWGVATNQHSSGQTAPISPKSTITTKTLNLGAPGPIEHYIWKHQGQTDEVWQNVQEGYWRSERTFVDGSSIKSIYKNGSLYDMHYSAKGDLQKAVQVVEPQGYNAISPVFDGLKQTGKGMKKIGTASYNDIGVNIYQVFDPQQKPLPPETYSKLFVDTVYQLPLKEDHIVNGSVTDIQTWSYDYVQSDNNLFTVPTNITFKKTSLTDANSGKQ